MLPNDTALVKDAEAKSCVSKLKYAALGHIDLSTLDFAKKDLSNAKKEGFSEKSRSVIDIPANFSNQNNTSREGYQIRSFTRMKNNE
mmetsp:Transcript_24757/g.33123  ORF Transcript_24757/g.33123 Transcript_24757/m.33123 type:complete len:87 (-) Transcript_24757:894-1154(-)